MEATTEVDLPIEQKYADLLQRHANLLKDHASLRQEADGLGFSLDQRTRERDSLSESGMEYQRRLTALETTIASMNSKELRLNFTALHGRVPILWVKAGKGVIDHRQFARLRDGIKRLCPDIEMIIMTEGQTDLYELSDGDLNAMGLARISGEILERPTPTPTLADLREAGEREEA